MEEFKLYEESAERSVIGALLLDNKALYKCEFLQPDMFGFEKYKQVFTIIKNNIVNNQPCDAVTIYSELNATGNDELIGGLGGIVDIVQSTPSAANIARYAHIVKDRYIDRKILNAGAEIQKLVTESSGLTSEEKIGEVNRIAGAIADGVTTKKRVSSAADAARGAVERIDKAYSMPDGEMLGLSSGIRELDKETNGFQEGQLIVIPARTSMGKSVLAENISRHIATHGNQVRFHAYEMSAASLAMRAFAAMSEIRLDKLKKGDLSDAEWNNLSLAVAAYSELPLTIDCDIIGVHEIAMRAWQQKNTIGLKALFIDHLLLMPRPNKNNDASELGYITKFLKNLAVDLAIPIFLVTQLNRENEKRQDKRPMLSDLKASGSIEEDADIVISPHRPWYYNKEENPNEASLYLLKNRDGEMSGENGIVVGWQGQYQKFTNDIDVWIPSAPTEKSTFDSAWDI